MCACGEGMKQGGTKWIPFFGGETNNRNFYLCDFSSATLIGIYERIKVNEAGNESHEMTDRGEKRLERKFSY